MFRLCAKALRTYARASRRQASTPDIPRPPAMCRRSGRDACTFGVVLDTSGSMDRELLGRALGAIASYAEAREVSAVRLVLCDAAPYDQGFVAPTDLRGVFPVQGRGGTVLQPAINYLLNRPDFPASAPDHDYHGRLVRGGIARAARTLLRDAAQRLEGRRDAPAHLRPHLPRPQTGAGTMNKPLLPLSVSEQMKTAEPSLLKEMAEYYRIGLELKLISVSEAMTWIDSVLICDTEPDMALIEASLSGSRGASTVADELAGVEGSALREEVARRLLARMSVLLSSDAETAKQIVGWLNRMADEDYAPTPQAKAEMQGLEEDFDLAYDGIYSRVAEVTEELRNVFAAVCLKRQLPEQRNGY